MFWDLLVFWVQVLWEFHPWFVVILLPCVSLQNAVLILLRASDNIPNCSGSTPSSRVLGPSCQ